MRFNAPFGAQCFPTLDEGLKALRDYVVSMHLLVLSAFRPAGEVVSVPVPGFNAPFGAQCFPTKRSVRSRSQDLRFNAPFGAQCFPTTSGDVNAAYIIGFNAPFGAQCFPTETREYTSRPSSVSMHLLVLSAFRRLITLSGTIFSCFNAPFGAQCFPTFHPSIGHYCPCRFNAPFGAQCFPTRRGSEPARHRPQVSMHLLVLSAFRLLRKKANPWPSSGFNAPFGAQCFPTTV